MQSKSTPQPLQWKDRLRLAKPPEMAVLMVLAVLVGVGAGFGSVLFRLMIEGFSSVAFGTGSRAFFFLGDYYIVLIPAIGGLIVGPLVYFFAREARGHGVPEVMQAVALHGGRIRPVVMAVKTLASSICIGFGGSAGREGPIVQIGSSLGSAIGQLLKMSADRTRTLVACGAAGGIAATFNAPVAGVLFALEVVLAEFAVANFSTVVVSAVTASVISQIFVGSEPAFSVPPYALRSSWELVFYVILGLIAAFVGVGFIKSLFHFETYFDRLGLPEWFKPAVGGLGVGVIGLWFPEVFGVGYETIETILRSEANILSWVALLLVFKILATSLTLGSGGSGGVFAPSLFMGAMLGGVFGGLVHRWFPGITALPGAYALVGMAAVFGASARAPISAVIILFEMTGDYRIILPLMLATVIATMLAGHMEKESIYTMKLSRRGIHVRRGRDIDVMEGVRVSEVMSQEVFPVDEEMPLNRLVEHFQGERFHACPVVDKAGLLTGIVSLGDIDTALQKEDQDKLRAADLAAKVVITVFEDEPMWSALDKMAPRDLSTLPVVDRSDPRRLIGIIRRRDIVRAYRRSTLQRMDIEARIAQAKLVGRSGAHFIEVGVSRNSRAMGKKLSDLSLPSSCILVSVVRGERVEIPRGGTRLREGDKLTIFVESERDEEIRRLFDPEIN